MNSIRSHLATRLLLGFVLLLGFASALVYFISQKILEDDFDARLFANAHAVMASISQKGDKVDIDWDNMPREFGPHGKQTDLIQVLDGAGRRLGGDAAGNTHDFPIPDRNGYG